MDAQGERYYVTRHFCIKPTIGDLGQVWPKGAYCVYRSGGVCPMGMSNGWVYWDDKYWRGGNKKGGELPDGEYDYNTKIEYCCQRTGEWYNAIELPVDHPFYLLPPNFLSTPKCQVVKWALSSLEHILYDTSDPVFDGDRRSGDHVFIETNGRKSSPRLYYCYYQGCRHQMNVSNGFIKSPVRSPDGYSQYQYCSWSITVHATHVVLLNFTRLTISNCGESFLKIYDGSNESAPVLATLCGSTMASQVRLMSSKNTVFMVLNAGNNELKPENSLEFEVKYTAQQMPGCRYQLSGSVGFIRSPSREGDYLYCRYSSWLITVGSNHIILLHFTYLTLPNCNGSFLQIYDGVNDSAPVLAMYCGPSATSGVQVLLPTNNVFMVLKSVEYRQNDRNSSGFEVEYSAQEKSRTTLLPGTMLLPGTTLLLGTTLSAHGAESSELPVTYIIIAVVVGVLSIILMVTIAVIYRKRKRRHLGTEANLIRGINPAYEIRQMATLPTQGEPNCYATPSSPEEKLWVGGSMVCKESRNPIYEPAESDPITLHSSADNITYEPAVPEEAQSENPLYNVPDVSTLPAYAEPTSSTERHYDIPENER